MEAGETIEVSERIIVSPAVGFYEPLSGGLDIEAGDVIGHVVVPGQEPMVVRSPFRGRLVEVAWSGERVLHRQRIAWLRGAA